MSFEASSWFNHFWDLCFINLLLVTLESILLTMTLGTNVREDLASLTVGRTLVRNKGDISNRDLPYRREWREETVLSTNLIQV